MRLSDGLIRRINYNRGLPPDRSLLQYHPQKEALQFIDPWEHHLIQIPADGSPAIVSPKPYEGFWDKGRQSKVVPLLNKDGYLHLGYNMYT